MKYCLYLILFFFIFVSCKNETNTPVVKPQQFDKIAYADSLKSERKKSVPTVKQGIVPKKDSIKSITQTFGSRQADTIHLKITYGKVKVDTIKQPRQRMVFIFDSDTAKKLNLKLTTQDTLANLRISQIIDSNGNSDGPFGRETQYNILEKGIHQIIVAESQMAGEPWGGRFTFEVKLGW